MEIPIINKNSGLSKKGLVILIFAILIIAGLGIFLIFTLATKKAPAPAGGGLPQIGALPPSGAAPAPQITEEVNEAVEIAQNANQDFADKIKSEILHPKPSVIKQILPQKATGLAQISPEDFINALQTYLNTPPSQRNVLRQIPDSELNILNQTSKDVAINYLKAASNLLRQNSVQIQDLVVAINLSAVQDASSKFQQIIANQQDIVNNLKNLPVPSDWINIQKSGIGLLENQMQLTEALSNINTQPMETIIAIENYQSASTRWADLLNQAKSRMAQQNISLNDIGTY